MYEERWSIGILKLRKFKNVTNTWGFCYVAISVTERMGNVTTQVD